MPDVIAQHPDTVVQVLGWVIAGLCMAVGALCGVIMKLWVKLDTRTGEFVALMTRAIATIEKCSKVAQL